MQEKHVRVFPHMVFLLNIMISSHTMFSEYATFFSLQLNKIYYVQ